MSAAKPRATSSCRDYTTTGDGFVAALQVLAVVKKQNQPVSKVCHRFDPLPQVLKNVRYRSGKPLETAKVRSAIEEAEQRLNGHGRLIVRSSGTEPVIRVMAEGEDRGAGRGGRRRHRRCPEPRRRLIPELPRNRRPAPARRRA